MKLISCHVENFGKLSDYSLEFSPAENIILQENGWGKSTFAAFIRAMFYGLSGSRKQNLQENERKKYKPWQGGVFGGQLTFECKGKKYTVSRVFRERDGQDDFELRDAETNLISRDYSEKLGEEIFRLSRESFMRSVFISQADCETAVTDDIHARVGNLTDKINDMDSYQQAIDALTALQNQLTPHRKTGAIYRKQEEKAALQRSLNERRELEDELENRRNSLLETEEDIRKIKVLSEELQKKEDEALKGEAAKEERASRQRIKDRLREKEMALKRAGDAFPEEIPEIEKINSTIHILQDAERKEARASVYELTEEETEELRRLKNNYGSGFPNDNSLEKARDSLNEYVTLEGIIRGETPDENEVEERRQLESMLSGIKEDPEDIRELYKERNIQRELLEKRRRILKETEEAKSKNSRQILIPTLLTIGAILLIAGAVLLVFGNKIIGASALTAGIALVMMGVLVNKVSKQTEEDDQEEELILKIRTDIANIEEADLRIKNFFDSCGILPEEAEIPALLNDISEMKRRLEHLKMRENDPKLAEDTEKRKRIENQLQRFLSLYQENASAYGKREEFQNGIRTIEKDRERYHSLQTKQRKKQEYESSAEEDFERVSSFLSAYGFQMEDDPMKQLLNIRDRTDDWNDARRDLTDVEYELRQFNESHPETSDEPVPSEKNPDLILSVQDLRREKEAALEDLENLQDRRFLLKNDINRLSKNLLQKKEDEETLSELSLSIERDTVRFTRAVLAKEYLEKAREAVITRYAEPLLHSFGEFYARITGEEADTYHMDASLEVTTEEKGLQRSTESLSSGYRDLVGICLRAALVQAMYREEKPFMVMDDPFTNLDDDKTRRSREFLKKLSSEYQIIYLTCSSYRS